MAGLRLTNFGGIVPKLAARRLTGDSAQSADNVLLASGELHPMRQSTIVWTPTAADAIRSFFRVDDANWFGWPVEFVDMRPAPIEGTPRYAYTGDGAPKITTKTIGLPAQSSGAPAVSRVLGVPTPALKPAVLHAGGSGAAETRFYVYTFVSDLEEESSPSTPSDLANGKVDGTWTISGMDDEPRNSGAISGAVHAAGVVTVTFTAPHYLREGEPFTVADVVGMTDLNGARTVASVPSATTVTVALSTAQTYTSGGTWTRAVPWGTCTKRLYRTTGSTGDFQLVAEGLTGTGYADTLTLAQIPGDSIVSDGWVPPPPDMVGLRALSNGVLAGFRSGGRTVCFCEPYQPHAWPEAYQVKVPDNIVTVEPYDTNLVVVTNGSPVVLSGLEPGQMSPVRHAKPLPGVARAGACSVTDGVIYASERGPVRADLAGAGLFAVELFSPEDWLELSPSTMKFAFDGASLLMATTVGRRMLALDVIGGGAQLVTITQEVEALAVDEGTGRVYFSLGLDVWLLNDPQAAPRTLDWWSREYVMDKPMNFGAAKVETLPADSRRAADLLAGVRAAALAANQALIAAPGGLRGAWAASRWARRTWAGSSLDPLPSADPLVSMTFYVGEDVLFSTAVPSDAAFRLPAGYRADTFSVRVQSNTQIRAILLGETGRSLGAA